MADEKMIQHARNIYEKTKAVFTAKELKFDPIDDKMVIKTGIRGDDFPIDVTVIVNPNAQAISMYSVLPFEVKEDKMAEMALAVCVANNGMIQGGFDYDVKEGRVLTKISNSFIETDLSEELIFVMFMRFAQLADEYNDRFFMLNKGLIDLEKFIELRQQ
ncbi:MAG: hypothetical protein IKU25_05655 [Clostridia bacterium]|nr:hypothetical protein [Clostridia bacterium]